MIQRRRVVPIAESHSCYVAFKAKDARFDGRFFVGVSSTGIYCRPVCPAKLPREENCTFYASAAAAERAGYRPCLLCRPELAPGSAPIDATSALAGRAARLLEENCGSGQNIEEYVHHLGCTARHLRRAFATAFKVSPIQYLQTCRLLLAKNLLTDTNLSVTEIAMASGFGSLRRFNDLFKKQYRLPPTTLRRQAAATQTKDDSITLMLGYRPPYRWEQIIGFLDQQAIPGVEIVSDDSYMRTVRYVNEKRRHLCGWIRVAHRRQKNALTVTVSSALLPVLPFLLARIRTMFDLHCYPDPIYETLSVMNNIKPGLCVPGTRLPGCFEPFAMSVHAILNRQLTLKAACTLAGKLAEACGTPVETGLAGLTYTFPSAHDIAAMDADIADRLASLGITRSLAGAILALAKGIVSGEIDFALCAEPEEQIKKLMSIPGIGSRTAQYIAMRASGWPDAFPYTDCGIKKALAPLSENEIRKLAEAWRPWRSYAAIHLWNSLMNL